MTRSPCFPVFETEPLQIAEREYSHLRRRFIDFDTFFAEKGRWSRHYLILGSHKTAFDRCCHVSLCDHSHSPYPVHGLVRPYLRAIGTLQGGEIPTVYDESLLMRQAPLYFRKPIAGELAVVDLDAAFWQLYRVASLDMLYDGVRAPQTGRVRFLGSSELRPHKLLRNAIIGTCRAETQTVIDFGKVDRVETGPRYRRPALWAWIMDTLEAIAWDMRSLFGAVHIQTDGYVLPHADLAADAVEYLRSTWHLDASIRCQGEGIVNGLGHWMVGETTRRDHDDGQGPLPVRTRQIRTHETEEEEVMRDRRLSVSGLRVEKDSSGEESPTSSDPRSLRAKALRGDESIESTSRHEGFPEPFSSPGTSFDNMDSTRDRSDLRSWFVDAHAYFEETPNIVCKGLDDRSVPW